MGIGFKLTLLLLALITAMGIAGKFYYNETQERLAILQQNNANLETSVKAQEGTIASLREDYARANSELQRVNTEFYRIRQQNNMLASKLERHDIGILASAKPGLVERIVNRASQKALRCFEILSGAELTEDEKNATSANSFNSECPWLWPNNTTP